VRHLTARIASPAPQVSVNRGGAYANGGRDGSAPTGSAYVTFSRPEEALRCIEAVDGTELDGRVLRACLGTTKYCHAFLRYQPCGASQPRYVRSVG
jgi:CCR4-NOT transcription complex subunit 4